MSWIGDRVAAVDRRKPRPREELERLLNIWRKAALADADLPTKARRIRLALFSSIPAKPLKTDFVYSDSIPGRHRGMRDVDAETALRRPCEKDASAS
jgi:hypothetical protein